MVATTRINNSTTTTINIIWNTANNNVLTCNKYMITVLIYIIARIIISHSITILIAILLDIIIINTNIVKTNMPIITHQTHHSGPLSA